MLVLFLRCAWLPPTLALSQCCADFFCFLLYENQFCSPAINQTSLVSLKTGFYYFLRGPWIFKTVNCFCPLVLSTCHNWELLISNPARPLCFKRIRTATTTSFLISNTVVPNPYSDSTVFHLQSVAPFS